MVWLPLSGVGFIIEPNRTSKLACTAQGEIQPNISRLWMTYFQARRFCQFCFVLNGSGKFCLLFIALSPPWNLQSANERLYKQETDICIMWFLSPLKRDFLWPNIIKYMYLSLTLLCWNVSAMSFIIYSSLTLWVTESRKSNGNNEILNCFKRTMLTALHIYCIQNRSLFHGPRFRPIIRLFRNIQRLCRKLDCTTFQF